jgi:hypothetical protein
MSIFKDTLKPEVIAQLRARQEVIAQENRDGNNNPNGTFVGYQTKNSWVKMTSLVNYDSGNDVQIGESNEVNISSDGLYQGDELSRKYVLFGGVPYETNYSSSLRYGIDKANSVYGSNLDYPSYRNINRLDRPFGIRPMPGISSVQISSKSAYGSLREAVVKFYCWDRHQLEELEILFMRPGYSVILEWGWSKYIDYTDQIYQNISNVSKPTTINSKLFTISNFTHPFINVYDKNLNIDNIYNIIDDKVKKAKCNYDSMLGYVKNFNWTMLDNGGFECTTTLISVGEVISSLKISSNTSQLGDETNIFADPETQKSYQYTDYEKILLTLKASSDSADFLENGSYNNVNLSDIKVNEIITELGNKMSARGHKTLFDTYLNTSSTGGFAKQPYLKKNITTSTTQGDSINIYNEYISFDVWIALMDSYFLLVDPSNNSKYLYFEIPTNINYCLAAPDSISIDPTVCYVNNPLAFPEINYIYDRPYTLNKNKGVLSKLTYKNGTSNKSLLNFYDATKRLGILKNIYINIDYLLGIFKNMNSSTNDDGVNLLDYVQNILNGLSTSLGGLNNFKVFPKENKIIIGDTYYVEDPNESKTNKKFQFDLLGLKSICRDVNITSRIFQEQSTMIGIAAQSKANIGDIYSSSQTIFNAGLTDRLVLNKNLPGVSNTSNPTSTGISNSSDALYNKLFLLVSYIKQYVIGQPYYVAQGASDDDQYQISNPPNPSASSSTLRTILLQFNPEINFKALIPFELEMVLDGIGGFVIGQIFTVNKNILPKDYYNKNLGFIITGISHDLSKNDWITTIKTQICLLDDDLGTRDKRVGTLSKALNTARIRKVQELVSKYLKKSLNYIILRDYIYYLANKSLASYMFADLTNSNAVGSNVYSDINDTSTAVTNINSTYRYQALNKFYQATTSDQPLEYFDAAGSNNVGDFINKEGSEEWYPAKQASFVTSTGLTVPTADNYGYTEFAKDWINNVINNTSTSIKSLRLSSTETTTYSQLLDKYKQEISIYEANNYSDSSTFEAFDPSLYIPIRKAIADTTTNTPLTPNSPIWDKTLVQQTTTITLRPSNQNSPPKDVSINYINFSTDILRKNIQDYLDNITGTTPDLRVLHDVYAGTLDNQILASTGLLNTYSSSPIYNQYDLKLIVGTNTLGNEGKIAINSEFIKYYQITGGRGGASGNINDGAASRAPYTSHRN